MNPGSRVFILLMGLTAAFLPGVRAQDTLLRLVRQSPLAAKDFSVDNLGSLYVITPDNQLKKYNGKGDSVAVFNEVKRYGVLNAVNVTNPLKILLFYKDFMTVLALDNFLNRLYTIDLRQGGILQ